MSGWRRVTHARIDAGSPAPRLVTSDQEDYLDQTQYPEVPGGPHNKKHRVGAAIEQHKGKVSSQAIMIITNQQGVLCLCAGAGWRSGPF